MMESIKDVFLCHASEDKKSIIKPLTDALDQNGISYWLDKDGIAWGDSLIKKVNEGLKYSNYVIVVLSEAFVEKPWPERELNAALNIESSTGEVKVLPLLVGDKKTRQNILLTYPLLNDKRYLEWKGSVEPIIEALKIRLSKRDDSETTHVNDTIQTKKVRDIKIPPLKKKFTELDKDLFVKKSFAEIKEYFHEGLKRLEKHYDEVNTDFTELSSVAFMSTIYVHGERKCGCKIWISDLNTIGYVEGTSLGLSNAESFNEIINVEENENELRLKLTFGLIGMTSNEKALNSEQAAETLWKRFTDLLGY